MRKIEEPFRDIDSMKRCLADRYPQGSIEIEAIDSATGMHRVLEVPRYLYRGESILRSETLSSMGRLRSHSHRIFAAVPREHHKSFFGGIENVAIRAEAAFREWLDLDQMASAGFAQHYGLPSELLDFSRSLDVAIGFAVDEPARWEAPRTASVAVLDVARAAGQAIVIDLSHLLAWARRPARQEAYGFFHRAEVDLKAESLMDDVGLAWHEVTIAPDEGAEHVLLDELLDAHRDPAAGVLQLVLDELAASDGGWPEPLANFFADAVTAAPFVLKLDQDPGHSAMRGALVSLEEAGLPFNKMRERELNRRLWRTSYGQTSPHERHEKLIELRAEASANGESNMSR